MNASRRTIEVDTPVGIGVLDLTPQIRDYVTATGIRNGMLVVTSRRATTALAINENESRLIEDLKGFLEELVPSQRPYLHNDIHLRDCPADEPENARSHLMAMLLGSSEAIPIVDGQLDLGTWQSVLLIELDGPRTRGVSVYAYGE